jgi:calcium-dependent protein kinase
MLPTSNAQDPLDLESEPWPTVSESAKDLIRRLMMKDPKKRLSASQALSHPWVREGGSAPDIPLCYDVVTSLNRFAKQSKLKRLFFTLFAQEWPETSQVCPRLGFSI